MSDRNQLIRAEARELARHRAAGGSDDYLKARWKLVDRLYGHGSKDLIRELAERIKQENEDDRFADD